VGAFSMRFGRRLFVMLRRQFLDVMTLARQEEN